MNNYELGEKINFVAEKEKNREKEPIPEKVVLFIRHPSVTSRDFQIKEAELEDKDIETYLSIDWEGAKMNELLAKYFENNFADILKTKEGKPVDYEIRTSNIRRTQNGCDIFLDILKADHNENKDIILPANEIPVKSDRYDEITNPYSKEEIARFSEQAQKEGKNTTELLYLNNPEKIAEALEKIRPKVEESLESFKNDETSRFVIFGHRANIALHFWLIEQRKLGRKDFHITPKDIPSFVEIARRIPFTSINEIDLVKGEFASRKIGETPHLGKRKDLIEGTF